jgi:hypothetical protein
MSPKHKPLPKTRAKDNGSLDDSTPFEDFETRLKNLEREADLILAAQKMLDAPQAMIFVPFRSDKYGDLYFVSDS